MVHPNITVQIMAGGRSTRMGSDKALAKLGGRTLLERAVETWRGWGGTLAVSVGSRERAELAPAGTVPIFDVYPHCGPLGGLHGGLTVCSTEFLLLLAVDTPFLGPELGERLAAGIGTATACVFTVDARPQPLFGLYRASCLPVAEKLLASGERRMRALLEEVPTVYLPAEDGVPFQNLNTPEALADADKTFFL